MAPKAVNDNRPLPRWMTRAELAYDLAVSEDTIDALVGQGRLPKPVYLTPRLPRWEREAVDKALGIVRAVNDDQLAEEVSSGFADKIRAARQKKARRRHR